MVEQSVADCLALRKEGSTALANRVKQMQQVGPAHLQHRPAVPEPTRLALCSAPPPCCTASTPRCFHAVRCAALMLRCPHAALPGVYGAPGGGGADHPARAGGRPHPGESCQRSVPSRAGRARWS